MKILVVILTYDGTQKNADACIATWVNDIQYPHEYYFYGSKTQSEKMDKTWNCEPNDGEHRIRLPEKTYKMLNESLNHDWDFLFKCDDDTFVAFDKLIDLLKNYDSKSDLYLGRRILFDKKFEYAQGGAGYILTRSSVKKCIKSLKHFYGEDFKKNESAEDYSVGLALKEQNINFTHTDLLSTNINSKNDQLICNDAIMRDNKITTHYVKSETMLSLYGSFNKKLLICIYSSHMDLDIAKKLRKQINNSTIKNQKNIIVLSDINQSDDFRYDNNEGILYVKVKECYTHLSLKTKLMFKACSSLFDYDFLVKWDASTKIEERCYGQKDRAEINLQELKKFTYDRHYYSHLNASCNGIESKEWFIACKKRFLPILIQEKRDLDSQHFIPQKINYFRGKFYIISNEFCTFMKNSSECDNIFQKNFQHNFGSEDLSVGMCFWKFREKLLGKHNDKS